eukprot:240295_1
MSELITNEMNRQFCLFLRDLNDMAFAWWHDGEFQWKSSADLYDNVFEHIKKQKVYVNQKNAKCILKKVKGIGDTTADYILRWFDGYDDAKNINKILTSKQRQEYMAMKRTNPRQAHSPEEKKQILCEKYLILFTSGAFSQIRSNEKHLIIYFLVLLYCHYWKKDKNKCVVNNAVSAASLFIKKEINVKPTFSSYTFIGPQSSGIKTKFTAVPRFVTNPSVLLHINKIASKEHIDIIKTLKFYRSKKRSYEQIQSDSEEIEILAPAPKKQKREHEYINSTLSNGDCYSFSVDKNDEHYPKRLEKGLELSLEHFTRTKKCPICNVCILLNEYAVHVNACLDSSEKVDLESNNNVMNECDINMDKYKCYGLVLKCMKYTYGDKWEKYLDIFVDEEVDDKVFINIDKSDLKAMGIKTGKSIKIKTWLDEYKQLN